MPDAKDFQREMAAMDPRLTGRDEAPLKMTLTLDFEPALLKAVAAESIEKKCSIEEIILATLRERFATG